MRATVSAPSSPPASPIPVPLASIASSASSTANKHGGGSRKRGKYTKSKLNLAGLVSGDSDSSALTQESGDEAGAVETPIESVVTGTDAGTDYAEDEDVEMRDPSPAHEASPKPSRGRLSKTGRRGGRGASTRGGSMRGVKKKKRS